MSPPSFPVVLLLVLLATIAAAAGSNMDEEVVDDLQYLIDNSDDIPTNDPDGWPEGDYDDDDLLFQDQDQDLTGHQPEIDETHVVVLTAANFSSFLAATRHVMVEFYAPWCGHCKKLAPILDEAATTLQSDEEVVIAKMDATANDVPSEFDVQGYPTLYFVTPSGKVTSYDSGRTADDIVDFIKKSKETAAAAATTTQVPPASEKAAAAEPVKDEL